MVFVRTDANSRIGMGHLMRCLSVADAVKKQGGTVCFVVADESAALFLEGRGRQYRMLSASGEDPEEELAEFLPMLETEKPGALLVDSYRVTKRYLESVKERVRTAYLDDLFSLDAYPADVLINYNIYGDALAYAERVKPDTKLLLGTAYVPLREEFLGRDHAVSERAEHILITTGGSDRYNLAGQILKALLKNPGTADLQYHVVSGAFNENLPSLQEMAAASEQVHIHRDVKDMAELMDKCDIAVSAGGSTMYELCAVGLPIVCFSFADNQRRLTETFVGRGAAAYGGDYESRSAALAAEIAEQTEKLIVDRSLRETYAGRAKKLVDGLGAARIAAALCGVSDTAQN